MHAKKRNKLSKKLEQLEVLLKQHGIEDLGHVTLLNDGEAGFMSDGRVVASNEHLFIFCDHELDSCLATGIELQRPAELPQGIEERAIRVLAKEFT